MKCLSGRQSVQSKMGSASRYIFFAKDVAPGGRLTMGHCTETKKIDWVALKRADWSVNTMSFQAVIFQCKIHLYHWNLSSTMSCVGLPVASTGSVVVLVSIVMPSVLAWWIGVVIMVISIIGIGTSILVPIPIWTIFICDIIASPFINSVVRHFSLRIHVKTDTENTRIWCRFYTKVLYFFTDADQSEQRQRDNPNWERTTFRRQPETSDTETGDRYDFARQLENLAIYNILPDISTILPDN